MQTSRNRRARIALIGLPGAGKTTVGRLLADALDWTFFDCDAAFEAAAGERISAWVGVHGWAAFREREREILAAALEGERCVIATGGGVVEKRENRRALAESATVLWLDAPPEALAERLGALGDRPLLAEAPAARIGELYDERKPLYAALADIKIAVADSDPPEVTARIMDSLRFYKLIP